MNLAELRTRVCYALNDDPAAPVYFDSATLNKTIQDGIEVLAESTGTFRVTHRIVRRPGAMLYHIAGIGDNIQCPWRIWLPDLNRRLEPVDITELDARHELWMTVTGDPYWWFPVDWRGFGIWPVPTTGGGIMEVDCYQWPEALLDDGDEVTDLALGDHELLVHYSEAEGYLRQWDPGRASHAWGLFTERLPGVGAMNGVQRTVSRDSVRANRPYGGRQIPFFTG